MQQHLALVGPCHCSRHCTSCGSGTLCSSRPWRMPSRSYSSRDIAVTMFRHALEMQAYRMRWCRRLTTPDDNCSPMDISHTTAVLLMSAREKRLTPRTTRPSFENFTDQGSHRPLDGRSQRGGWTQRMGAIRSISKWVREENPAHKPLHKLWVA